MGEHGRAAGAGVFDGLVVVVPSRSHQHEGRTDERCKIDDPLEIGAGVGDEELSPCGDVVRLGVVLLPADAGELHAVLPHERLQSGGILAVLRIDEEVLRAEPELCG